MISGATNAGEITVTVAIEGGTKYAAGDVGTFKVTFIPKESSSGDLDHGIADQTGVKWGTSSDTPAKPDWAAETHGKIFFTVSSYGTTGSGATIARETGVISGATNAGEITVTVAIEGGTKYAAGDVGTFKVTFIPKESSSGDLDHGIDDQTGVKWGSSSDTPAKPDWDEGTHGKIFFTVSSYGTTGSGATIARETGVISGATNAGEITVTVAIEGGTKYAAGDVGTFKVTFIPKESSSVDLVHGMPIKQV